MYFFKLEVMFFDKQLFCRRPDVLLHSSGGKSELVGNSNKLVSSLPYSQAGKEFIDVTEGIASIIFFNFYSIFYYFPFCRVTQGTRRFSLQ